MRRYEELSEIFSDKDNYSQSRELLKEVGFTIIMELALKTGNQVLHKDVIYIIQQVQ